MQESSPFTCTAHISLMLIAELPGALRDSAPTCPDEGMSWRHLTGLSPRIALNLQQPPDAYETFQLSSGFQMLPDSNSPHCRIEPRPRWLSGTKLKQLVLTLRRKGRNRRAGHQNRHFKLSFSFYATPAASSAEVWPAFHAERPACGLALVPD